MSNERQTLANDTGFMSNLQSMVGGDPAPAADAPEIATPVAEQPPVETPEAAPEVEAQETPVVEAEAQPQEEVQEPSEAPIQEDHQPETPSSAPSTSQFSDDDIADYLYDQTGGKIDSIDELKALVDKAESAPASPSFNNDLVAQMVELDRQGVKVTPELIANLNVDYKSMDHTNMDVAKDLILRQLKAETPDITDAEVRAVMREFEIDEDVMDDDQIDATKAKAIREARKAKAFLEQNKSQYIVPTQATPAQIAEQQAQVHEQQEQLTKEIRSAARHLDEVSFDVNGDTYSYQVSSEEKKSLREQALNSNEFFNQFFDEAKQLKGKELMEFFAWQSPEMRTKMLSVVKGQAASSAKKEVVSGLKNSSAPTPPTNPNHTPKAKEPMLQVADQLFGMQNGRRGAR